VELAITPGADPSAQVRTFLALAPDAGLCAQLEQARPTLSVHFRLESARWIEPVNHHITLVFLGMTALQQLAQLQQRVREAMAGLSAFRYVLNRVDWFPDSARPRVIAALAAGHEGFGTWHRRLHAAMAGEGFRLDDRPYLPHLSLARWRGRAPAQPAPALDVCWHGMARSVVLYQSSNARYQPLFSVDCNDA
jgi:RNA 2',3'-cyclic 3'-phosphodiesterase